MTSRNLIKHFHAECIHKKKYKPTRLMNLQALPTLSIDTNQQTMCYHIYKRMVGKVKIRLSVTPKTDFHQS